jgi:hypothetical protein
VETRRTRTRRTRWRSGGGGRKRRSRRRNNRRSFLVGSCHWSRPEWAEGGPRRVEGKGELKDEEELLELLEEEVL